MTNESGFENFADPQVDPVFVPPYHGAGTPPGDAAQEARIESKSGLEPNARDAKPTPMVDGLPPKPKTARYNLLDSVRGIACLMLVFYHAAFYAEYSWSTGDSSTWTIGGLAISLISRLWVGVPMFFVVSGYCIGASVDSLRRKPRSLSNYFYRRFRRIYPPLWAGFVVAVLATVLVGLVSTTLRDNCLQLPVLSSFTFVDWVGNFSAAASWLPRLFGQESNYLLKNTWTLCYEEQFYVVTGLILFISARRFFTAAYALVAITIVVRHACRLAGIETNGFFFDGHWLMFAAGILLYQQVNYLKGKQYWRATGALTLGVVYGLGDRLFAADAHDRHMGEYILVAAAFAIFLAAIKRWDPQISKHWLLAPFRWCGKISYSIYLVHFPITILVACMLSMAGVEKDGHVLLLTIPLCLLLSLPASMLFYDRVERHFINVPSK